MKNSTKISQVLKTNTLTTYSTPSPYQLFFFNKIIYVLRIFIKTIIFLFFCDYYGYVNLRTEISKIFKKSNREGVLNLIPSRKIHNPILVDLNESFGLLDF